MAWQMTYSRAVPVSAETAYDALLAAPLPELFSRRYGPIPPVREVREQDGAWGTVGQTRRVVFADGGSVREELTSLARPEQFTYRLTEIGGPMRLLVSSVEGRWSVTPDGTGCRITWAWTVHSTNGVTARLGGPFRRCWEGFARQGFDEIETLLLAS